MQQTKNSVKKKPGQQTKKRTGSTKDLGRPKKRNNSEQQIRKKKSNRSNSNKSKKQSKSKQLEKSQPRSLLEKKGINYLFDILFYVVLISIIGSAILFTFSNNQNKSLFGYRIFNVLTNSMAANDRDKQSGGFSSGDVIIVQMIAGDQAKPGDIITYHPSMESEAFLTHRVIEKRDGLNDMEGIYYITKGDNNNAEDIPVSAKQVVGKKVLVIPKMGLILTFIRENLFVSIVFILSVIGFIWIMRLYFFTKK